MDNANPGQPPEAEAQLQESTASTEQSNSLLILPVRETVLFPGVLFPISIGRPVGSEPSSKCARSSRSAH